MLKWQTSTSDQQESSWICKIRSDQSDNKYAEKFLTNNTLCTLSYVQLCIFFVFMESTWTRMVWNTMHIYSKCASILLRFFYLIILEFHDLFIFMPHGNLWMARYNLSSGKVAKKANLSSQCQGRMSTKQSFFLYNNQTNARAVIGQSAVGYCSGKPTEKSRVFWIIIQKQ